MNLLSRIRSFHTFRIKEDIVETVLLWGRIGRGSRGKSLGGNKGSIMIKKLMEGKVQ